jgi:hypothetical protein
LLAGLALAALLIITVTLVSVPASTAISESDVVSSDTAIQSAFVLTFRAERSGGNVTSLVAALNSALQLVEKAQAENSTNPAQASSDLHAAQQLAQNVTTESAGVSAAGSSFKEFVFMRSVVSAAAILFAAVFALVFGGRVFRWFWVRVYRGYVVRPANG